MKRALIVDDREDGRYYLSEVLKANGFEVEIAAHGVEALEKAGANPPALVISDLLMPVMDGYTLLRQWKAHPRFSRIPFVVYTATYTDPADEDLALNLGADAFILKPCEPEALMEKILHASGGAPAPPTRLPIDDGQALLLEYNEALIRKLEAKTLQLEDANRKLASEIAERRLQNERQVAILDALPAQVVLLDGGGTILAVNESWKSSLPGGDAGAPALAPGQNFCDLCESPDAGRLGLSSRLAAPVQAVLQSDSGVVSLEYPCHSAGQKRWLRMVAAPLRRGEPGAVVVHSDITERMLAQEQLRESEENYLLLLNSTAEGIVGLDRDGVTRFANPAAIRLLGYTDAAEILGRPFHASHFGPHPDGGACPGPDCELHRSVFSGEEYHSDREHFLRAGGESFPVEYWSYPIRRGGSPDGAVLAFLDISERRLLETQLLQAQKMEAVGQLTGGIAHDFNNLLTVILGYTEILRSRLGFDPALLRLLAPVIDAGSRAAELTSQLLAFSRRQRLNLELRPVDDAVLAARPLLERLIREDIQLHWALNAAGAPVRLDLSRFQQVILNLVINSRDAMPAGGDITVETALVQLDAAFCKTHPDLKPGPFVRLSVSDTGVGMSPATLQHIFEPFFTTKQPGAGTGLGLSIVYGMVKQVGGQVTVESRLGAGSRFDIYLPLASGQLPVAAQREALPESVRGHETILVVEDDSGVRAFAVTTLEGLGYDVIQAHNGADAIRTLESCSGSVQLVLTDIVMPGMSGPDLAASITARWPGIRILFTSGYSGPASAREASLQPGVHFLPKPFSAGDLAQKIRSVLSQPLPRPAPKILILEDDPAVRDFLAVSLREAGFETSACADGRDAIGLLRRSQASLLITDLVMPGQEGIETIGLVKKEFPGLKILAISGYAGGEYLRLAALLGADRTLAKPIDSETLLAAVRALTSE